MTPTRAVQFNMSFGVGFAPQKLLFRQEEAEAERTIVRSSSLTHSGSAAPPLHPGSSNASASAKPSFPPPPFIHSAKAIPPHTADDAECEVSIDTSEPFQVRKELTIVLRHLGVGQTTLEIHFLATKYILPPRTAFETIGVFRHFQAGGEAYSPHYFLATSVLLPSAAFEIVMLSDSRFKPIQEVHA